jgi:YidC/Oxa1 family membrane protein insertase
MSRKKRPFGKLLLVVVGTVLLFALIFGLLTAIFGSSQPSTPAAPAVPPSPSTTAPPAAAPVVPPGDVPPTPRPSPATTDPAATQPTDVPAAPAPAEAPSPAPAPAAGPEAQTPAITAPVTSWRVRTRPGTESGPVWRSIGSSDPSTAPDAWRYEVTFSPLGAGIARLALANQRAAVEPGSPPEVVQELQTLDGGRTVIVPFSLTAVTLNGTPFNLFNRRVGDGFVDIWEQTSASPGQAVFTAVIEDGTGAEMVRVVRAYRLKPGGYDMVLDQRIDNLSGLPLDVTYTQFGPADLPKGIIRYGGDLRRLRFGFLEREAVNPGRQTVSAQRFISVHQALLGEVRQDPATGTLFFPPLKVWPTPESQEDQVQLSWFALTNRYFAVAVHTIPERQSPRADGLPDKSLASVPELWTSALAPQGDPRRASTDGVAALWFTSPRYSLRPGQHLDVPLGVYAGPMTRRVLDADPLLREVGLGELVIYKMTVSGPCALCTFQWIAGPLRGYLGFLERFVVFDWALAIILLVFTVRTLLHPVTRWSQKNLLRFGKQMAALAPKQAKLKEKYGHDPKKLREEVARLMQEEKVNYFGALGCVPMFMQMPIWIALYAMIFFTYELRHEGAFFGLFQWLPSMLGAGHWMFLADLAEPDHFIYFGAGNGFSIPLLSGLMGPIEGLNVIPLLMGVLLWVQQKYMSPPTTSQLTPEQESTQRITKVMIVLMIPIFMYNAPAALNLYFMTNSILGIIESRWIRQHVEAEDRLLEERRRQSGGRDRGDPPRPGFIARIQKALEEKQKEIERRRKEQERRRG